MIKIFKTLNSFALLLFIFLPIENAKAQLLTGYPKKENKPAYNTIQRNQTIPMVSPYRDRQASDLRAAQEIQRNKANYPSETFEEPSKRVPVDLTADNLLHDDKTQTITASGKVVINQAGRTLHADQVKYNLKNDTVIAKGNVILHEPTGDVHFAEEITLSDNMKNGFVYGLNSYLSQGGYFTAEKGERKNAETVVLSNASYTPCDCETDEDGNPVWQIKADQVTYHEKENRISYKNARFEIFGIPTLWTPYLSHTDGRVKRKSGVLTPSFGYDSELGAVFTPKYYWSISPDQDATIGLLFSTQELPVLLTEYRRRFVDAEIEFDTSISHSARTVEEDGVDVRKGEELRGHLFGKGRWDINELYRAGFDIELTSDDQYLRQFDISSKSLLENEVYLERFSGRDYAIARAIAFEDTRIDIERVDQPDILPEVVLSFFGEPNALFGGRWSLGGSALGLLRDGGGQDVNRFVVEGSWQKKHIFDMGLVTSIDTLLRGDAYRTNDKDSATTASGRSTEGTETRAYTRAHIETSYPFVKSYEKGQAIIEPMAALTLSPNVNVGDNDIPNEDSQDVQLDASNLFEPNRFPGLDRIEDRSHVTYGLKTGFYDYQGSHINLFLGQSYRFDNEVLFPEGSGLSEQDSDYVGHISGVYKDQYGLNYRFQLGNGDFSSQRHEMDAYANWDRVSNSTRYLFAEEIAGVLGNESREQVESSLGLKLTNSWKFRTGALYDLGEDPGLRKAKFAFDYIGCCLAFSVAAERNLTRDSSGESGTDITFRLGLKNIGEFQSGGVSDAGFGGYNNWGKE
jgi:LPS-assembly protein